ncbi:MAG TPA: response regulator [Patescibacteria group bacterium]
MNKIKILIADDSAFMRRVLKGILEKGGYTNTVEAENGRQALEKFKAEKPDLILLDIVMPEVDGIEVLKKIGSKANIIVISAVGQDVIMEDAKKSGAKGYIVKPFDEKEVLEEVNKVAPR